MKEVLRISHFILILLMLFHNGEAQLSGIDSMKSELSRAPDDSSKVFMLTRLARVYSINGMPDSSQVCARKALELSRQLHFARGEAIAHTGLAAGFFGKGNMTEALNHYLASLRIADSLKDSLSVSRAYNGVGNVNLMNGNFEEALKYHKMALEINLKNGYSEMLHHSYNNLGNIYLSQNRLDEARQNFEASLVIRKELGLMREVADIYSNLGVIYSIKKEHLNALEQYKMSMAIHEETGDQEGVAIDCNNIGSAYTYIGNHSAARTFLNKALEMGKQSGSLDAIRVTYQSLAELDSITGNHAGEVANYKMFIVYRDSIHNVQTAREQTKSQMQYEFDKKEALAKAEQEKKDVLAQGELQRQKIIRNGFLSGFAAMLLFSGIVLVQRNRIRIGKKRSDELLKNILPAETAEELKLKGSADARSYDEVTVMFTDLNNFTQASAQLSAADLVHEMNFIYSSFDQITQKHNLEKIKTIGDSYMCAGGLPVPNNSHAADAVLAALELQEFFSQYLKSDSPLAKNEIGLRIGIHTGPVVAGIVGLKKFAYDIWGDTVNLASRMESSGVPGKVNISESTYELVRHKFNCQPRGKVEAKNKGLVDMYFVNGMQSND